MSPNRTLLRHLLALVLLASAAAGPLHAQPELDERISLELKEADIQPVLESFGSILEREVEVDPAIDGTISIELHNVRVETALDAVCESVGCLWKMDARRLRMTPDPDHEPPKPRPQPQPTPAGLDEPIDISLKDADVRETLTAFGRLSGLPVVIDDDVQGKATVELHDVPARQALDVLCQVQGCVWEVVDSAEGSVIHVHKAD